MATPISMLPTRYDNDKTRRGSTSAPMLLLLLVVVFVLGAVGYYGGVHAWGPPASGAASYDQQRHLLPEVTGGSLTGIATATKSPAKGVMDDLDRLHDALVERTALGRESKALSSKAQRELARVKEKLGAARSALRAQLEASRAYESKASGAEGIIVKLRASLRDCANKLVGRATGRALGGEGVAAAAVAAAADVPVAHLEPDTDAVVKGGKVAVAGADEVAAAAAAAADAAAGAGAAEAAAAAATAGPPTCQVVVEAREDCPCKAGNCGDHTSCTNDPRCCFDSSVDPAHHPWCFKKTGRAAINTAPVASALVPPARAGPAAGAGAGAGAGLVGTVKGTGLVTAKQNEVVGAMKWAWKGYKEHSWGLDELHPVSKRGSDWFKLALTMVDAMDTMLVMGEPMKADYEEIKVWMTANFAQVRTTHSSRVCNRRLQETARDTDSNSSYIVTVCTVC